MEKKALSSSVFEPHMMLLDLYGPKYTIYFNNVLHRICIYDTNVQVMVSWPLFVHGIKISLPPADLNVISILDL